MKKFAGFILVLLIALVVLVGCEKKQTFLPPASQPAVTPTPAPTPMPAPAPKPAPAKPAKK